MYRLFVPALLTLVIFGDPALGQRPTRFEVTMEDDKKFVVVVDWPLMVSPTKDKKGQKGQKFESKWIRNINGSGKGYVNVEVESPDRPLGLVKIEPPNVFRRNEGVLEPVDVAKVKSWKRVPLLADHIHWIPGHWVVDVNTGALHWIAPVQAVRFERSTKKEGRLPFAEMPDVKQIPADGLRQEDFAPTTSVDRSPDHFQVQFPSAASFPLPRFDLAGGPMAAEGAMIYEGMHFLANKDGRYQTSFLVSSPGMPVTLRLQFRVYVQHGETWESFAITMPPVVIDPPTRTHGNYKGSIWRVQHAGYSPVLARVMQDWESVSLARTGTARFGKLPLVDEKMGGSLTWIP